MADRNVSIRLRAEVAGYLAGIRSAERATTDFGNKTLAHAQKNRAAYQGVGLAVGGVGLAAVAGAGLAVKSFADFDKSMSAVAAATGKSGRAMDGLRQAALDAGAKTKYSATEAAGGIEALAKAGVSTKDIIGGGLGGALNLAAAGEIDVGEAAETAATAMTQFKLSGKDVPHIADLLAAAAGKAQGDVGDMSFALKQSGLVASQMGLSVEETTGTLGAFASAGLLGSDAGTSFRTMLLRLANPAGKAANLMDDIGLSAYDAQGNFVGMASLAGQLKDRLSGMSQSQRDAALATIFGSDAIRAANVLYSQGEKGIQRWTRRVDDQGYAAKQAGRRMDNLHGDIEQLSGAFETAFIKTGSGSNFALRGSVKSVTSLVRAYGDLPGPVQTATLAVAGVGGAAAVAGGAMLILIPRVAETRVALQTLGVTAARTRGALMTMGKVAGVVGALYTVTEAARYLNEQVGSPTPEIDKLTEGLRRLGKGGRVGAEGADLVTRNLAGFDDALRRIVEPSNFERFNNGLDAIGGKLTGWALGDSLGVLDDARDALHGVDQTLTKMVRSGNADEASKAFLKLEARARANGISLAQLRRILPTYTRAAAKAREENGRGEEAARGAAAGNRRNADAMSAAKVAAKQLEAELATLSAHMSEDSARIEYEKQMRSLTKALRANGTSISFNTREGRKNRESIIKRAEAAVTYAGQIRDAAKGTDREAAAGRRANAVLADARTRFLRAADSAGINAKQARNLADRYFGLKQRTDKIPKDVKIPTTAPGLDATHRGVLRLNDAVHSMRGKSITVRVNLAGNTVGLLDKSTGQVRVLGKSGSGSYATGGKIRGPGTKTSDDVPIMASAGEYMQQASAVDYYGVDVMDALNHKRIPKELLPGFARGGEVARDVDLTTLSASFASVGPQISRAISAGTSSFANSVAKWALANATGPALGWAKSQVGKPYIWGGVGPRGYDCSGFQSGITNVIQGHSPYHRRFATGSFPTGDFARGPGRYMIGSFRGNPGHMAGTLNGVNVESRGGQGVVVGSSARGAHDSLFGGNVWHLRGYAKGGQVAGDAPFDVLNPKGRDYDDRLAREIAGLRVRQYDSGGPLMPGLTLAYNGTGGVEEVSTPEQRRVRYSPPGGGGTQTVRILIDSDDEYLKRKLRKMVRVEGGGNVQIAFGKGAA